MEASRVGGEMAGSLEASVEISAGPETLAVLKSAEDLSAIFICSDVRLFSFEGELNVKVKKAEWPKCERCWNLRESVGKSETHKTLCERCVKVIQMLEGYGT